MYQQGKDRSPAASWISNTNVVELELFPNFLFLSNICLTSSRAAHLSPPNDRPLYKCSSMHGLIRHEFNRLSSSELFPGEYRSVWSERRPELVANAFFWKGGLAGASSQASAACWVSLWWLQGRYQPARNGKWLQAARACRCLWLCTQMLNMLNTCLQVKHT